MIDKSALDERALEEMLSEPSDRTREVLSGLKGDIVVLGAGGKMGPTLAMMLRRASKNRTVHAVSRFTDRAVKARLEQAGVKTVGADLLDESCYHDLPVAENVYYLVGMKFGATGNQPLTWALNSFLPGRIAQLYKNSRIVALSTGNVYPFVDPADGGSREDMTCDPVGEYAQSCLGRERICQYFSLQNNTPMTIARLNYANEPRYGIIVDLTLKIMNDEPINPGTPAVNLIWQRDANDYIVRAIALARSPAMVLNVTGPEIVMVRRLATDIAKILDRKPAFLAKEEGRCLLSDACQCFEKLGPPETSLHEMVSMIVSWVAAGKPVLSKPTKYDVHDGKF
ncbi:MAG: NAD(P)-dependent oxidoreductase [Planctomycetes bacterium]|nr:NAD(P)-dependent oxidoreductase [Planctomycetota bacterium]